MAKEFLPTKKGLLKEEWSIKYAKPCKEVLVLSAIHIFAIHLSTATSLFTSKIIPTLEYFFPLTTFNAELLNAKK